MTVSPGNPCDFTGKRALVTGGTRGIGAAVARALARGGASLVLGYRSDEISARAMAAAIEEEGFESPALVPANLVHPEEARRLAAAAAAGGPVDFLVHAAALGTFKPALDVRANQWDLTFSVGTRSFLLLAQAVAPSMPRGGRLVALSSLGSVRVLPGYGALGPSKAALEAVVRQLAMELGPAGILVNAVSAGLVDTPSVRLHPDFDALAARSAAASPLGRIGTPEDVARVVVFLLGPLSGWITGQTILADAGASLGV
ncbi:MAG TPA: SDR family oxidoreductase [Thermoanaerobaculia bacterium]|nr:SDR family oxidoreductase [Thermoanaerobaculia bacterium]